MQLDERGRPQNEEYIITLGDSLNLGCGFRKIPSLINVDACSICEPDVVWDLNVFPWPWDDYTIDHIYAYHVFEHLDDWWGALKECARILKKGGKLMMRVPDESSSSAGTYRDHQHILANHSFSGLKAQEGSGMRSFGRGNNAWGASQEKIPLIITKYSQVPFKQYYWMVKWCPWLLQFCAKHMRNFIWEQRFEIIKIGDKNGRN